MLLQGRLHLISWRAHLVAPASCDTTDGVGIETAILIYCCWNTRATTHCAVKIKMQSPYVTADVDRLIFWPEFSLMGEIS